MQLITIGLPYIFLMSLLVAVLGALVASFYQKSEKYKGLYEAQKKINTYNYEYWLTFFQRHGILKEVILDEKTGDRRWVLLTDPIQEKRKEVQVALTEWMGTLMIGDWK